MDSEEYYEELTRMEVDGLTSVERKQLVSTLETLVVKKALVLVMGRLKLIENDWVRLNVFSSKRDMEELLRNQGRAAGALSVVEGLLALATEDEEGGNE